MNNFSIPQRRAEILLQLGYRHRARDNDYVKEDCNGRFHAIPKKGKLNLHYDFNGYHGRHITTMPLDNFIKAEQARILRQLSKKK